MNFQRVYETFRIGRKRSTRPEFKRWVFSSFAELVSRNTSAGGRGNAGCVQAGWPQRSSFSNAHPQEPLLEIWFRASHDHFTIYRGKAKLWLATGRPKKVLFVKGRREKITTDRHFADGEGEVACQSSLRHVAASADRKRCRNVLRFFVDGQE